MQLPVPVPDGVNTPPAVIVPPFAVHVTAELYAPVPALSRRMLQSALCVMDERRCDYSDPGDGDGGGAAVTVIFAEPDTFVYPAWAELALQLPVPVPEGVNTPPAESFRQLLST